VQKKIERNMTKRGKYYRFKFKKGKGEGGFEFFIIMKEGGT